MSLISKIYSNKHKWFTYCVLFTIMLFQTIPVVFAEESNMAGVSELEESNEELTIESKTDEELDYTPPIISAPSLVYYVGSGPINLLADVTAIDDRPGDVQVYLNGYEINGQEGVINNPESAIFQKDQVGKGYLYYEASDLAGNEAYFVRPIYIVDSNEESPKELDLKEVDLVPPEVTSAPVFLTVGEGTLETFKQKRKNLSAIDNIDGDITMQFELSEDPQTKRLDFNQVGKYLVTWEVKDSSNNSAKIKQWVFVKSE